VAVVTTDVSEERIIYDNSVPSSLILFALMRDATCSCEMLFLTRTTSQTTAFFGILVYVLVTVVLIVVVVTVHVFLMQICFNSLDTTFVYAMFRSLFPASLKKEQGLHSRNLVFKAVWEEMLIISVIIEKI
jgi:hypothetical protein